MAAQKKSGLGRGLDALFSNSLSEETEPKDAVREVPVSNVLPNPNQPRSDFNEEELAELSDSIKEHGVIQPLIVSEQNGGFYQLIAGERRLRASQLAGLSTVPVVVRKADDRDLVEIALIENIQREDLSPLETAEAYKKLEENYHLTHEEISKRVGKNRASITNTLRLLRLPEDVRRALADKKITEGHARVLLSLPTEEAQIAAMNYILQQEMNVRQAEAYIRSLLEGKTETKKAETPRLAPEMESIENMLRQIIGSKVTLKTGKNGAGSITIRYKSGDELEGILKKFGNY